jgi:pimeloyl-ACP methyl ester carboxylesterase
MKDEFWSERGIAYRTNTFEKSRETLVFIHGLASSSSIWEPFELALEHSFNILTYDMRGHGLSKRYKNYDDYDLKSFADDLQALLDHIGINSCSLVSHSMGTIVALFFQRYYSGTVRKNLFLAPAHKQHSLLGPAARGILSLFVELFSWMPFTPGHGKRLDYSKFGYCRDLEGRRLFPEIKNMSLRLYFYCMAQVYAFAHDNWWSEIRIPTTIVHGTKDTFAPYRLAVELSKAIPGAKIVTLEGANHLLVINNKREITTQILEL